MRIIIEETHIQSDNIWSSSAQVLRPNKCHIPYPYIQNECSKHIIIDFTITDIKSLNVVINGNNFQSNVHFINIKIFSNHNSLNVCNNTDNTYETRQSANNFMPI